MLSCLKTRLGEVHIINWTTFRGAHYTLCGKTFTNGDRVETFAADNTFPDMCPNCYEYQESSTKSIMNSNVREFRNDHVMDNSVSDYHSVQKGWGSIATRYDDMTTRYWNKSSRMRRKFPGEEWRPTKKRRKHKKLHGQSIIFTKRK